MTEDNQAQNNKTPQDAVPESEAAFHGAAIVDKDGREQPITEDMIKEACEKLDQPAASPQEDENSGETP